MKKFLAMLLAGAMLFSFAACNDSSKEEEEKDKKSGSEQQEYNPDDKYGDYNEEEFESNSDAHADGEYYIDSATDFINGHALLLLNSESSDTVYYAVTDLNGKITCKTEYNLLNSNVYENSFEASYGQRILIKKNNKDLMCKDINGNVIYTVNDIMASGDNISSAKPFMKPDGTTILTRVVTDIYEGNYLQFAYISSDGEIIQDWFDLVVDDTKISSASLVYYNNGVLCLSLSDLYKTVFLNLNDKSFYPEKEIQGSVSAAKTMMNGYFYTDSCVISDDGLVYDEGGYNKDSFYYNASDCLALNVYDNCFYDVATGEPVSQLPFNEKMRLTACSAFKNGYAMLIFYGADGEEYFTLVDRNGQFKFEPIEYNYSGYEANEIWDGEYILLINKKENKYEFYDASGQKVTEYSYEGIARELYGTTYVPGDTIANGMVKVMVHNIEPSCYNFIRYDGSMLFPDGRISLD